ncbi:MAG: drug resistance transporter, EmrB/QacA subfamily [Caulobacter sp.]|nr:drug resistance transporter, EmrB/QacA subfamily [Caulobacter sp.]
MTHALPETQTFTAEERRLTLAAVMIVFLLSAMDQTVVSTAMPRIVAELNGLQLYAWVTTAYLLSSTIMVPIWGKLGDIFGRKPTLLAAIGLFLLGSWLSGLAGEFGGPHFLGGGMVQLIVFRAVQGLGGGGLFVTAFAIIADLFPPRERGKFAGLFGAVFGVASIFGPLIGGYFTDHGTFHIGAHVVAGWRWVFYVNLPLTLLSLFMILVKMPALEHRASGAIDWWGSLLLVVTFVPLLLALSQGGQSMPWNSPQILGMFALGIVGLGLFLFVESKVSNPIIPLGLFKNRVFAAANGAGFLISMSFLGVVTFLPLYMQLGQGVSATASGLSMLPLMLGLITSSTVAGRMVSKIGRYKPFMIGGAVLLLVGVFLLGRVNEFTTPLDLAWRMLIVGLGLGPGQSLFGIAAQNAVPVTQIGVATSSNQFFRQIGSTVGVAVFGALLAQNLPKQADGTPLDLGALEGMAIKAVAAGHAAAVDPILRHDISHAITSVFAFALATIALGIVVILMIPEIPLRTLQPRGEPILVKDHSPESEAEAEAEAKAAT